MRHDPRLGAPAPPLPPDALTHFLPNAPTILIFVGACNSCQTRVLMDWQEIHDKWGGKLNIVAISRDTRENIETFRKYHKVLLPMLPDADGEIARQYNAVWTPRIYGVREGKVVYVQKDGPTAMLPEDIARRVAGREEG
ncbi:MAG: peroxiredoxin family protein [Abditibacteriales bacterium]|nr:peroxiredoxin family protein [Abditibacteriales bacterium]